MAAGDTCVTDPVDTVHGYEMDTLVCSHYVYKYVWLPVIGEKFVQEKEPAN